MDFIKQNLTSIIAIAPVHQASEQPIEVQVIKHPEETTSYGWTRRAWNETKITKLGTEETQ